MEAMLAVVNAAAQAYRGVIPADRWHEPYMPAAELRSEIESGVDFVVCEVDGAVAGVMGIQPVRNVDLIRHAYVLPALQGHGIGGAMMRQLRRRTVEASWHPEGCRRRPRPSRASPTRAT